MKHKIKDSVFTYLFKMKKYSLELYKAFFPNDNNVSEDDIDIITIETILVNGLYNDLGLLVKNTLILMVEAQSTWSDNIVVRLLPYLGETISNYFKDNNVSLYSDRKIKMPNIELFVVYTGDKKVDKDELSLNELFYDNKGNIDIRVKVISKYNESKIFKNKNIVSEYIKFADISTRLEKEYGRSKETAAKVIDECINEGVLKEFMVEHKREVIGIMDVLYNEDIVMKGYAKELKEEGMQQVLVNLFKNKKISAQEGADYLSISVNEFLELVK